MPERLALRLAAARLRAEDGAIAVFALFIFVGMLLVAGVAIDMMRVEHERVRMQGATDRAVVAATMLRSTGGRTPGEIVEGYLRAEGLEAHVADRVQITDQGYSREVTATPAAQLPSTFMRLLGIDGVTVATPSQARESIARVDFEIVMVLDVSGSMAWDDRITAMRDAATAFAAAMFEGALPGQVAISIVPYSTEVRLPAPIMAALPDLAAATNMQAWDIDADGYPIYTNGALTYHTDPSCIDLRDWAGARVLAAAPAAAPWTRRYCDERSNTLFQTPESRVLMTDLAEIEAYVQAMGPVWGTHIDLGVAAGALLFDPALRPAMQAFVPPALAHTPLAGRPFDRDRPHTVRAMVVMTDGANCCYHPGDPGTRWAEPPPHDDATVETCRGLHDQGVTVYTVAFLAAERGVELMRDCASSPNHFYNSDANGLIDTFRSISRHIQLQSLRLTL